MSSSSERRQLNFSRRESILVADVSHINPLLGTVRQIYTREVDPFPYVDPAIQLYTSLFTITAKGSRQPANFSQLLSPEEKAALWMEIFGLKNRFLAEQYADVIVHDVKVQFSGERRLAMYRENLELEPNGYVIFGDKQSIYIERLGL